MKVAIWNTIINNADDPAVTLWRYREDNGKIRTYAWLEAWDYVVVLEKRSQRIGEVAFLVTGYHLDGDQSRRRMRQRYAKREP